MRPPQVSRSIDRATTAQNVQTFRLYQVWKGSNKFCLGGRLIFGPDARSILVTLSLIVVPVILYCVFVSPRFIHEFPHHMGLLNVAICVVFTVYDVFLLILTSGRDPGIIPRNPYPPEEDDGSTVSADWPTSLVGAPSIPPTKDVVVNGMVIKVKYCQTCMLYRPPRCSHCSICNNCVERFDHHCPWVGQCIGKRNYRFFFMFVSSTTILCLYVFAFSWVNVIKIMNAHHCNIWKAFVKSPVSGVLIGYTFIAAWFVGGLTVFHLYLISTNQTTYENFRYRYAGKMNPYNMGCARNIMEVFCSRIPNSRNNFRAKVKVDPSVFGHSFSRRSMSTEIPKRSSDVEMGKRQAVGAEDLEDIESQIESVGGLERCNTLASHTSFDEKVNLEITYDMRTTEFGMEYEATDKPKHHEDH